jgi:hypothetical protein
MKTVQKRPTDATKVHCEPIKLREMNRFSKLENRTMPPDYLAGLLTVPSVVVLLIQSLSLSLSDVKRAL